MRVSMDGRYDSSTGPKPTAASTNFSSPADDWHNLLTTPAPDAILVPRSDDVYPKLRAEPGWKEAYRDPWDAVFLPR